jgi:phage gpG-like protein
MAQVGGLRTPGGILIFDFEPSIGILADKIDTLGHEIESFKEPLTASVKMVIIPSIRQNFDEGGRPAWEPLADFTVSQRKGAAGPILIRSGRLRTDATQFARWMITDTAASIQNWPQSSWYGQLHQAGYGGRVSTKAVKKVRPGVVSAAQIMGGADSEGGAIPARPFIMYQPEDIPKIHEIFDQWLEEKIGDTWGRG